MNKIDQDEIQARLTAVRAKLSEWQVEGILISSPENRRWLSGFTGSSGYLLVTAVHALLATDFRYYEQAEQQAPAFTLFKHQRTQADSEKLLQTGRRLNHRL
jgi:Xaa-Pro aminopeptidase